MRRIAVIVSMALVISACSTRSDDAPSSSAVTTAGGAEVTVSVVAGDESASGVALLGAESLACGNDGQPCSWSDADPTVFAATHEIGQAALDRYAAGEPLVDIAIDLAADPRMAGLLVDDRAIVFRLDGGLATWVLADEVVEGERSGGGPAPDAPIRSVAAFDVVGEDPETKSALVVSPYLWQFTNDDESLEVAAMYGAARGYEGNVTLLTNTTAEQQVDINAFLGWGSYDVVHVSTHGLQVCEEGEACQTFLAVGKAYFDGVVEDGLTISYSRLGASWGVDNNWFTEHYPGGLPDTLVVLSGCQTAKGTELVATFGSGAVFAWTNTVLAPTARAASLELHRTLIETGATSRRAHEVVQQAGLNVSSYETTTGDRPRSITYAMGDDGLLYSITNPFERAQPLSTGAGPTIVRLDVEPETIVANLVRFGDELRVREVAWIDNPQGEGPLADGAVLRARLAPDADYLPVRLRVEGIDPGMEDDTALHLTIDGFSVGSWQASEGTPTGRWGEWLIEREVRLPQRVEDDDLIDMRLQIDLPEGGESVHEVDQVRLECLVGEWRLRSQEYVAALFEEAGGTAGVTVSVDSGEYRVALRQDGTYIGYRDGWTLEFATAEGTSYLTIDSEDPGTWQAAEGTITVSESGSEPVVTLEVEVNGARVRVGGQTPVSTDAISGSSEYECTPETLMTSFEGVPATFDRISP